MKLKALFSSRSRRLLPALLTFLCLSASAADRIGEVGNVTVGRFNYTLYQGDYPYKTGSERIDRYAKLSSASSPLDYPQTADTIPDYITYEGIDYKVIMFDFEFNINAYYPIQHVVLNRYFSNKYYENVSGDSNLGYLTYALGGSIDLSRGDITSLEGNQTVQSLKLGDGLHAVGSEASVTDCPNLSTLILSPLNSAIYVSGCSALENVVLGAYVQKVSPAVFNASNISVAALTPPAIDLSKEYDEVDLDAIAALQSSKTLHVPVGTAALYAEAPVWKSFGYIADDLDRNGNILDSHFTVDGIVYTLFNDGVNGTCARVVGPVDPDLYYLSIPSSVQSAGQSYNVTSIGDCAFVGCNNLHLDNNSLPYTISHVGNYAFTTNSALSAEMKGCVYDSPLALPSSLARVGDYAFANGWIDGRLPQSLRHVGDYAFYETVYANRDLEGNQILVLPQGIESIGSYAFTGNITHTVLPSSVKELGDFPIDYGRIWYEMETEIPGGSLKYIPAGNFCRPENDATPLIVPDGVVRIRTGLFYDFSLRADKVVLGRDIKSIDPYAIEAKDVYILAETPPAVTSVSMLTGDMESSKSRIHVLAGSLGKYRSDDNWKNYEIVGDVPENVAVDAEGWTFSVDPVLKVAEITGYANPGNHEGRIEIPSSVVYNGVSVPVTKIGRWAIGYNSADAEESYVIPASITKIDEFAFYNFPRDLYDVNYAPTTWKWYCKAAVPPTVHCVAAFQWPYRQYNEAFNGGSKSSIRLYVPEGSVDLYKADTVWKNSFSIVKDPDGTGAIESVENDKVDRSLPVMIYRPDGVRVFEGICSDASLTPGFYIVRQGPAAERICVR